MGKSKRSSDFASVASAQAKTKRVLSRRERIEETGVSSRRH